MASSKRVNIVKVGDALYESLPDGVLKPLKGNSDWARVDAMTEEQVEAAALSDKDKAEVMHQFAGRQFSEFKQELVDLAVSVLTPINTEMKRLLADPGHIDAVLRTGAERANAIAGPIIRDVYDIVGFLRP